jgi:hypothetical protein
MFLPVPQALDTGDMSAAQLLLQHVTFSVLSSDGAHALNLLTASPFALHDASSPHTDGSTVPVTVQTAKEFISRAVQCRLQETWQQVNAMRAGFAAVVPAAAVALFNWYERLCFE